MLSVEVTYVMYNVRRLSYRFLFVIKSIKQFSWNHWSHFLYSMPSGGLISVFLAPISSQFVLNTVPPDSYCKNKIKTVWVFIQVYDKITSCIPTRVKNARRNVTKKAHLHLQECELKHYYKYKYKQKRRKMYTAIQIFVIFKIRLQFLKKNTCRGGNIKVGKYLEFCIMLTNDFIIAFFVSSVPSPYIFWNKLLSAASPSSLSSLSFSVMSWTILSQFLLPPDDGYVWAMFWSATANVSYTDISMGNVLLSYCK